jgi:hypothetical protein
MSVSLAVLAAGALLAGCGSGKSGSTATQASTPPISKAQASAIATAVNLRPSDVPGMTSAAREAGEESSSPEVLCGLRQAHDALVDAKSPKFARGSGFELTEVESEVEVMDGAAKARAKFAEVHAALTKPSVRSCLERAFVQAFRKGLAKASTGGAQVKLGKTTVSLLIPSVPQSFGLEIVVPLTISIKGITLHSGVYVHGNGFLAGPALISLTTISLSKPFPSASEQHLLSLLSARAKTSSV